MAIIVAWLAIFSVVLVAGAGSLINDGSTATITINNSITMTHRSNLTLPPDVLNNITAGIIMPPSPDPAIIDRRNDMHTTSTTNETHVNTTIYMDKDSILKVIIPSLISFAGMALMVFLWWWSLRARVVGADDLPPIASFIADPTSSTISPTVELVNRTMQNQPPPLPPPATPEG